METTSAAEIKWKSTGLVPVYDGQYTNNSEEMDTIKIAVMEDPWFYYGTSGVNTKRDTQSIKQEVDFLIDQIDEDALVITNGGQWYPVFDAKKVLFDVHGVYTAHPHGFEESHFLSEGTSNTINIYNYGSKPGSADGIAENSQTAPIIDENVINIYGRGSTVGSADGIAKNSQTAPTIHGIVYGTDNFSSLSGDFIGNYADGNGGAIYYANSGVIIDDKIQPEQTIAWFGVAQNYNFKVSSAFFNLVALENSSDFVL